MVNGLMMGGPPPPQSAPPAGPVAQQPAAQQAADPAADARDEDTFDQMVAGLLEHLAGPAGKQAVEKLRKAESPAREAGTLAFALIKMAMEQAQQAQRPVDLDMALGIATEVIEALMTMAQAAKVKIADAEQFMAEALFTAIEAYSVSAPDDPEAQEAAKAMLAQMQADGLVQEGAAELQRLGAKVGVDPFAQATQAAPQPGLMGA